MNAILQACGALDQTCLSTIWDQAYLHKGQIGALLLGLIAVASLYVSANSLRLNLKRNRLEMATSLLSNWAKDLDWVANRAIGITTGLPDTIARDIFDRKSVTIPTEYYEGIATILRKGLPEDSLPSQPEAYVQEFRLTAEQSSYIRFQCVGWLNRLEAIVHTWYVGTADQVLMGRVFGQLIRSYRCEFEKLSAVTNLRTDLPLLSKFHEQLKEDGRIAVPQNFSLVPRWLPFVGSRVVTWPEDPKDCERLRHCDKPTCARCCCPLRQPSGAEDLAIA